jgi:hypothetical protein
MTLGEALDTLIRKYREVPFTSWEALYPSVGQLSDCASGRPTDDDWWQAQTDVLEISSALDGPRYARVVIAVYPEGSKALSPPPSTTLDFYDDGRVVGTWASGVAFEFFQLRSGAV